MSRLLEDDGAHVSGLCFCPVQQESMPFAVVGSDKEYQVNGKRVLGRKTPWGIIEGNSLHLLEELVADQLSSHHLLSIYRSRHCLRTYEMNVSQILPIRSLQSH